MNETASVNIPRDVIQPIVQAHIQAAIVSALGDGSALITAAVKKVLDTKVDPQTGQPSTYSNAKPFIEWIMQDCVMKAAKGVILEELPKHKEAIRASIAREMQKKNSPLLRQFVDGMMGSVASADRLRYRVSVDLGSND